LTLTTNIWILTFCDTKSTQGVQLPDFCVSAPLARVVEGVGGHSCLDQSRANGIDPDIRLLQLVRGVLCDGIYAASISAGRLKLLD
jgi:hypothetical protein